MIKVQELINDAIQSTSQYKTSTRNARLFHVSDAGRCYRMRYMKRLGIEPVGEIAIAGLRKMAAGDAGHAMLQNLLGHALFTHEKAVGDGKHIIGHFDGVVRHQGMKTLLEIKTVEKWGMTHIKGTCKCPEKETDPTHVGPKLQHELQMWTYWMYLRDDLRDLDTAVLSYVKREDFVAHDFIYNWSDPIEMAVLQEWAPLLAYWEREELPDCTCPGEYGGNGIKYCRYQSSDTTCCDMEVELKGAP